MSCAKKLEIAAEIPDAGLARTEHEIAQRRLALGALAEQPTRHALDRARLSQDRFGEAGPAGEIEIAEKDFLVGIVIQVEFAEFMSVERRLDRVVVGAHQFGQELLSRLCTRLGGNPVLNQINKLRVADHSTFQRLSRGRLSLKQLTPG